MIAQIEKKFSLFFCGVFATAIAFAQAPSPSFQSNNTKVVNIATKYVDTLKKQFQAKNISYPPVEMYLRSFKFDRELEVWVKGKETEQFVLLKTYKVCQQSGTMGPKRMEGDYQVPEGFYYINEFKPNSAYHLSMGVSYPNASDKILSDQKRPGSAIYVHGNCVSVGCIPIRDEPMEELFTLANNIMQSGTQEFIPIHVFPVKYSDKKSMEALTKAAESNAELKSFNANIKPVYDYFEAKKELPIIMVNQKGEYVLN